MKKSWLHLLMVLIAMQSTIAVADIHQAYQTGQEHVGFNHPVDLNGYSNLNQVEKINIDDQSNFEKQPDIKVSYDCHHCCHCHGVACHYLLKDDASFALYHGNDNIFESFNLYSTRIISPDLRPPIV